MTHNTATLLKVQIVRFVDDAQPGWVACEFQDAEGVCHTLIDKVPIFTEAALDRASTYPDSGDVSCQILGSWMDTQGRNLVRITTEKPDGVNSTEGLCEFVVLSSQLTRT
jgi:hypothetical protein